MKKNFDPEKMVDTITRFINTTLNNAGKKRAVIAVSGGIDSAVSLALLVQAIGKENVFPLLLPYKDQDMTDAQNLVEVIGIPEKNREVVQIGSVVDTVAEALVIGDDQLRLGNAMARARMIVVYDRAKKLDALVCGTENKSEKYLGYFTRFGDEASDFEPIVHLFKTQIRDMAEFLDLPTVFLEKSPSAGLWEGQTDEQELGFSYVEADQIIEHIIIKKMSKQDFIQAFDINEATVEVVLQRVASVSFKHQVPYSL